MMKTPYELLAEQEEQELFDTIYRLGLPAETSLTDNEAMARYIADSLEESWMFWLSLRLEQAEALKAALANGLELSVADMDDALLMALTTLYRYGLADLEGMTWHVNACVPGLLTLDEALKEQMRMQDALCDFMHGWLVHVGMMPMNELAARAARAVETDTEEAREELTQLCYALLVSRGGLDGMFLDVNAVPWAVHEELADPDALRKRLHMPFLANLPYPDLNDDDLVFAGGELGLPGDVKIYFPLLDLIRAHEAEDQFAEAMMLIENEQVDEAINTLTEACGLTSMQDVAMLTELVTDLSNAMPRWYNKGYSPDEMVMNMSGKKARAMPDRNDPCPCGSGRKYKQCCGRHVH